ncbi:DNA recombination protein RmuC [Eikenella sp. S3360]|uniref:DNA recombination protein RmuC n=1 Tax=Eikenella glucosivorans TaxID=2766967 RepID=A0ABS0N7I3_9NEIS|nr:DNA recombination protein RmuC [Eikenella glucosivorans]MBH5328264.1 DNA recombination protein RmuC [Eikenella glucosivorans]
MTFTLPALLASCLAAVLLGILFAWLWLRARQQAAQHGWQQETDRLQHSLALQQQLQQQSEQQQSQTAQDLADTRRQLAAVQQAAQDYQARSAAAEQSVQHFTNRLAEAAERQQQLLRDLSDTKQQLAAEQEESESRQSRAVAAEQSVQHLQRERSELAEQQQQLQSQLDTAQQELAASRLQHQRVQTQIEQQRQAHAEQIVLLNDARQNLSEQFQNLANRILEEKSQRFSEQNRKELDQLLHPLNEKLQGFSQLVQNTYEKEAKERNTLENELKRLQQLNARLHDDAQALTQALTGSRNKSQGNWGEMILEKVLESSGLTKGREYEVQSGGRHIEEDGSSRYLQPDVIVKLPDRKHIIIDSKVSLTAYVRYTQADSPEQAAAALAAHLASVHQHIKELAAKPYGEIEGIESPDFVLMFVPVEPAYLLALQQDPELFQTSFEKRIVLVGPSTLLATLRTVANIWRYENQNRNALQIAEEGGKLYDKFTGFVDTLEKVGKNLQQAQDSYQTAYKQLYSGTGNLVRRAEKLRQMGLKTNKRLDEKLVEQAGTDALPEPQEATTGEAAEE